VNAPLRCSCGSIRGHVSAPELAYRAVCYCKDCQAFARFLGRGDAILDEHGGTEIVATLPNRVHFTQGIEALACMSLSDRGLLRWYAICCNTPIGNTPRDFRVPYLGLVRTCLATDLPSQQEPFGPVRMVLNTKSAKGPVKSTPLRNVLPGLGVMKSVLAARLNGTYKRNPFFGDETGTPIVRSRELSRAERERFTGTA